MSAQSKALLSEKLAHVDCAQPVSIPHDATVGQALALMRERRAPCLMVCRGSKLVGIFTERDYLLKVAGGSRPDEPIAKYMTPDPVTGSLDETLSDAVQVMNAKGLRNLPLVDQEGVPVSLLTVGSVIAYLADHFPAAVVNRPPKPHLSADQTDGA